MTPSDRARPTAKPARAARPRGRPADRAGEETRAAVVAKAQELFARDGYRNVTLKMIADGCDLHSRALYYYFRTKRDLFDAALRDAIDRIGAAIATEVFQHDEAARRSDTYVDVFRQVHQADPHLLAFVGMVLVEHRASATGGGSLLQLGPDGDTFRAFLEVFIDDCIAAGEINPAIDRRAAVLLFMTIGIGIALASSSDSDTFLDMLDVLDMLNHGTLFTRPDEH
jgi:AcrR family transcriptional regulator